VWLTETAYVVTLRQMPTSPAGDWDVTILFVEPPLGEKLLGAKPAVCHSARASLTVSVDPGVAPSTRFGTGA
jgi:hypothetical protein